MILKTITRLWIVVKLSNYPFLLRQTNWNHFPTMTERVVRSNSSEARRFRGDKASVTFEPTVFPGWKVGKPPSFSYCSFRGRRFSRVSEKLKFSGEAPRRVQSPLSRALYGRIKFYSQPPLKSRPRKRNISEFCVSACFFFRLNRSGNSVRCVRPYLFSRARLENYWLVNNN